MKKVYILLILSMLILTGCFNKKTRDDIGSNSDYLEITNFTQGVEGSSGNALVTIGDTPLGTPILISSSIMIPIDKIVTINFTESINAQTVNSSTVFIADAAGNPIPAMITVVDKQINITPNEFFDPNSHYIIVITMDVKDIRGRSLQGIFNYSFPTASDTLTSPDLLSLTPANGVDAAATTTHVVITFSEAIMGNGVIMLRDNATGSLVKGTTSIVGSTLRFVPQNELTNGATYIASLLGTVEDFEENAYEGAISWRFSIVPLAPELPPIVPIAPPVVAPIAPPVPDTTAPVITLTGANPQTLEMGSAYVELNASTDDGSPITIDSSTVDMNTVGAYNVTYNAMDASNNHAVEVIRTVFVEDTTAPIITLTGANPQTLEMGSAYVELNATTDDGSPITIDSSTVDMNTVGEYNVTYNAMDASNNHAVEVIRTVFVEDTTSPLVVLFTPEDGRVDVNISTDINVTFDENVTNGGNIIDLNDTTTGILISGSEGVSGNTLWFTPDSLLIEDHNYTVTIVGNTTDSSGNVYSGSKVWSFTTAPVIDTTPPEVLNFIPADGAIDVKSNTKIKMIFNEEIINTGIVLKMTDNTQGGTVGGASGYTDNTLWFIPDTILNEEHNYTVTIQGPTKDLSGNVYAGQTSWSFTVIPFEVKRVHYTDNTIGVYFTDKLDPSGVSASDFQIDSGSITFHDFVYIGSIKGVWFTADEDLVGDEIISVSGDINDTLGHKVNNGVPMDYSL